MEADSVTLKGPILAMIVGAAILVFGMAQGGLNAISTAGGILILAGVSWLAVKIDAAG